MIPDPADSTVYHGDVYVLQHGGDVEGQGEIVGVMQAMKFRRYPRGLLNRFFSAADVKNPDSAGGVSVGVAYSHGDSPVKPDPARETIQAPSLAKPAQVMLEMSKQFIPEPAPKPTAEPATKEKTSPSAQKTATVAPDSTSSAASKAMALVAAETGLEASELKDEATFAKVGVDSLMSLVIAEKMREQLGIAVSGSLSLKYPTVGALRAWRLEYHS